MPDKRQVPSAPHTASKKKDNKNALTLVGQQYSGPLPPPNILEHYNAIYPDSAKIIIDNFIAQSEHRRSLEKTVINAGSRDSLLGSISAFIFRAVGTEAAKMVSYDIQAIIFFLT
jgi:uncharacterized membrane protein